LSAEVIMHRTLLLSSLLSLVAGCAGSPEIVLANPITAMRLGESRIVHHSPYIEQQHGVAPGTYDDEARIASLDGTKACFDVTMHVPPTALLDFRRVGAELSITPSKQRIERASVQVVPRSEKGHEGLVPTVGYVGERTYCVDSTPQGGCRRWDTMAVHDTVMVPGQVKVREERGRFCFSHQGAIDATTSLLRLDLAHEGHRFITFRWGFDVQRTVVTR